MTTTDIEKESLEAHVELCSERYKTLKENIISVDTRMGKVELLLADLKTAFFEARQDGLKSEQRKNLKIIGWGIFLIVALLGVIATMVPYLID